MKKPTTWKACQEALDEARRELVDLRATFDLRHAADQRAIAVWRKGRTGRRLTWPDHADLVVWLLAKVEWLTQERDEAQSLHWFALAHRLAKIVGAQSLNDLEDATRAAVQAKEAALDRLHKAMLATGETVFTPERDLAEVVRDLRGAKEEAEAYCDGQQYRSDYRTVTEMRRALEAAEASEGALLDQMAGTRRNG